MKKLIIFLCFALIAAPVFAAMIKLNSGSTLEGKILERSETQIKFQKAASEIKEIYYLDEIASIDGKDLRPAPASETPVMSEAQAWAELHQAQSANATQTSPEITPSEESQISTDVNSSGETQNMEQSQPAEQILPIEQTQPSNNPQLSISAQPPVAVNYPSSGIVEGEIGSSVMALKDGTIGQVVLFLVDGINMTVWVKEDTTFEGKKSVEDLGSGDLVWVNYMTKNNKKYATRIKVFSKIVKSIRSSVGRFPENIQSQPNEVVKEGEVSDIANLKISMEGKVVSDSLGNFRVSFADDMSVTIHVLKDTAVEGLSDSFDKINAGDTVSVAYVLIKHQNFAKNIKVLKKAAASVEEQEP